MADASGEWVGVVPVCWLGLLCVRQSGADPSTRSFFHAQQSFHRLLPDDQPHPSSTSPDSTTIEPQPPLHQTDASTPADSAVAAKGEGTVTTALGAAREDVGRLVSGLQTLEAAVQGVVGELEGVSDWKGNGCMLDRTVGWLDGWLDGWECVCLPLHVEEDGLDA